MAEEIIEAKDDFDTKSDEFFDKMEKETPADASGEATSTDIKPEDHANDTDVPTGAEPEKTEQVKEVEDDESLSVEDKIDKVKEILGDDQNAIDAYVKEKGYHNDPAWIKQRERIESLEKESEAKTAMSDEDKQALADFKELSSSSEFIQMSMKNKGFTQEAIDAKLVELGHNVDVKPEDDLQFVLDKTGTKKEDLNENQLAQLEDVVKVVKLLFDDKMSKVLPKELAPLKDDISKREKEAGSTKLIDSMKNTVKTEAILDYDKDIEPALNKFLDDNPDAVQQDILEHFKSINHTMSIERLKGGKRQEERDEKKGELRQNISTIGTPAGTPEKTGNFDKDADAFLEAAGVQ